MSEISPQIGQTNTTTIARNSFWYGTEMAYTILATTITSIAMARVLGPERLGYFNYVMWLANMSGLIGSVGIPLTTRKYMAEYLGRGEPGIARSIYFKTLRMQSVVAALTTVCGLILVFTVSDPRYRLTSAFQVASMFPGMVVLISAQANTAREDLKANVLASVVGYTIYFAGVVVSLVAGWGVLGVAVVIFLGRVAEFLVRTVPVVRWVLHLPYGECPEGLHRRMFAFSGNSLLLMILNIVVWDRSDLIFLKLLNSDIRQISFFSVAFNLTEKALVLPQTVGQAIGASIMAQYGREKSRVSSMVSVAARYMLFFSAPLLVGLSVLSPAIIPTLYGREYASAIPVLAIAALLAIPKPLLIPVQQLMQAAEDQSFMVKWSCFCGIVNIALDLALIPHFAAKGAALANGVAQSACMAGLWWKAIHTYSVRVAYRPICRMLACVAAIALSVLPLSFWLKPWLAAVIGIPVGALVFSVLVRHWQVIEVDDYERFLRLQDRVRTPMLRELYARSLRLVAAPDVARAAFAGATESIVFRSGPAVAMEGKK